MKLRGTGTCTVILVFLAVLCGARYSFLGISPTATNDLPALIAFCLVPALVLSFTGSQIERVTTFRSQSLQMAGTVGGLYLVVSHPDFHRFFFSVHSAGTCSSSLFILRTVNSGLFLGALLGASMVFTLGLGEFLLVWIGQLDQRSIAVPYFSGRLVYFALVLTLVGERLAMMFLDRIIINCKI